MNPRSVPGILAILLLLPAQAAAHAGADHGASLLHGLGHPLGGADHLLAMVAVGLLAARHGGRALWGLPALFLAGMVAGGALGLAGAAGPGVEPGILLSVVLLGALLTAAWTGPAAVGAALVLVGLSGAFHGMAHGMEMPAAGSALPYAAGVLIASAALHAGGIGAVATLRRRIREGAALRTLRLSGLAIGAAGAALAMAG